MDIPERCIRQPVIVAKHQREGRVPASKVQSRASQINVGYCLLTPATLQNVFETRLPLYRILFHNATADKMVAVLLFNTGRRYTQGNPGRLDVD
jgi:hypothetical protein